MSEYQYYEFAAIDRPLSSAEIAELRGISTRATISPNRFVNIYNFGDFRGDPLALMERYFDAFVYEANWGTRQLMLRLPAHMFDLGNLEPHCIDESVDVHRRGQHAILDITLGEQEPDWVENSEQWMPALLPLREELAGGDPRVLYLGWLAAVQSGFLEDDDREPPVPPGLSNLSPALKSLAEFLRLDPDLLEVAAQESTAPAESSTSSRDLADWIRQLPASDKDDLLLRLAEQGDSAVRAELRLRFRRAQSVSSPRAPSRPTGRTVQALLAAADERSTERRRREAEAKAREQSRRDKERAAARAVYLDGLIGREQSLWEEAEALVRTTKQDNYDRAVNLLVDLRDLSARTGASSDFTARLSSLLTRHANKPSLLRRLAQAGLPNVDA